MTRRLAFLYVVQTDAIDIDILVVAVFFIREGLRDVAVCVCVCVFVCIYLEMCVRDFGLGIPHQLVHIETQARICIDTSHINLYKTSLTHTHALAPTHSLCRRNRLQHRLPRPQALQPDLHPQQDKWCAIEP